MPKNKKHGQQMPPHHAKSIKTESRFSKSSFTSRRTYSANYHPRAQRCATRGPANVNSFSHAQRCVTSPTLRHRSASHELRAESQRPRKTVSHEPRCVTQPGKKCFSRPFGIVVLAVVAVVVAMVVTSNARNKSRASRGKHHI